MIIQKQTNNNVLNWYQNNIKNIILNNEKINIKNDIEFTDNGAIILNNNKIIGTINNLNNNFKLKNIINYNVKCIDIDFEDNRDINVIKDINLIIN